ncbi:hydroxypyruvate reductase [Aureococcus anophagefferens]|nr:hydroxypyruvate reductase [Aureococcus anophagefferens]
MAALPGLALLQVLSAGHEFVAMDAVPRGATVCNSSSMDVPIAEYCVAAVLEARVRCRVLHDAMRASRTWRPPFYEAAPAASACVHGELEGAAVALVGFGAIGRAVAARLGPSAAASTSRGPKRRRRSSTRCSSATSSCSPAA